MIEIGGYFDTVKTDCMKHANMAYLPEQGTEDSAGYDFATVTPFGIPPHSHSPLIFTNIKAHIEKGYCLMLFVRSSVGIKKGCILSNCVGIIDKSFFENPDNDGNIGFKLYNTTDDIVTFDRGDKIIQGIFVKVGQSQNGNVDTERVSGIGSTGV